MIWQYGLTTMPVRRDTLLPKTLTSLSLAGFDQPRLFVDNSKDIEGYERQFCLPVTIRHPRVGNYANWMLSMVTLWYENPWADRYALFEDDFVTLKNLKQYLEQQPYPDKGYCNLYTFPKNQGLSYGRKGWYRSDQLGKGAVALVFDNPTLESLLTHPGVIGHTREWHKKREKFHTRTGLAKIDGLIIEVMKQRKIHEYVHNPSLVQHTGIVSSFSNQKQPLATSFPGEEFDALQLLDDCTVHS